MSVKIISEIGVNWNGDLDIAKSMILESKRSGVDYVKFQMFNEQVIKNYSEDLKKELEPMILNQDTLCELIRYTHDQDIKFGISTMHPEAFNLLNVLSEKPDFIKIRCADNKNKRIIRQAVNYCVLNKIKLIASFEKPPDDFCRYNLFKLIASFEKLPDDFCRCNLYYIPIVFMYCIPKYPPELNDHNIHLIGNTNFFSGFSNHHPSTHLPIIAIVKGSNLNDFFVEVHVKPDNISFTPIDEAVSLTFNQLYELCDLRDTINKLHRR